MVAYTVSPHIRESHLFEVSTLKMWARPFGPPPKITVLDVGNAEEFNKLLSLLLCQPHVTIVFHIYVPGFKDSLINTVEYGKGPFQFTSLGLEIMSMCI